MIIFLEIKDFKRPDIHRQDKVERLQDVGPEGMVGLRLQWRFSANYFQTAILLLAEGLHGEGGLNLWRLSCRDRLAGTRIFPRDSENLFLQGQVASNSYAAVVGGPAFKERRVIQGGGGGHGMPE